MKIVLREISNPIRFKKVDTYYIEDQCVKRRIGTFHFSESHKGDELEVYINAPKKDFIIAAFTAGIKPEFSILFANKELDVSSRKIKIASSEYVLKTDAEYLYHSGIDDLYYINLLSSKFPHTKEEIARTYIGDSIFECAAYLIDKGMIKVKDIDVYTPTNKLKSMPSRMTKQLPTLPNNSVRWGIVISGVQTIDSFPDGKRHFLDYMMGYQSQIGRDWVEFLKQQSARLEAIATSIRFLREKFTTQPDWKPKDIMFRESTTTVDGIYINYSGGKYYFPHVGISPNPVGLQACLSEQAERLYKQKADIIKALAIIAKSKIF